MEGKGAQHVVRCGACGEATVGGRGGASGGSGRCGGWKVALYGRRRRGSRRKLGGGKEAGFGLEWGEWAGLKAEVEGKERGRGLYRKLDGLNGSSSDQSRKCWDLGMNGH